MEDRLGKSIVILAYPYGESNENIQNMALMVGYHCACGVTR